MMAMSDNEQPQSQPLSTYNFNYDPCKLMTRTIAHYRRIEQIGEGTYGQVYKAEDLRTKQIVAMKKIRIPENSNTGLPQTAVREIKILKELSHPHMVHLIEMVTSKGAEDLDEEDEFKGYARAKKNDAGDSNQANNDRKYSEKENDADNSSTRIKKHKDHIGNLFLVLEYIPHDLTGLTDMNYPFEEVQIKCLFRQLLEVLHYMHEKRYVHRDIKSSNILIDWNFRLKLADFGLARSISPRYDDSATSDRGFTNKVITLWYRPPELLLGATDYGTGVDMFSAGCILAELILGRPILPGKSEVEQLKLTFDLIGSPTDSSWPGFSDLPLIKNGQINVKESEPKLRTRYKEKMPVTALGLIEKLLIADPYKRLSARGALNSRYFVQEPVAPENPADLGKLKIEGAVEGGNYHEFQTKKIRKEAKAVADQVKKEAKSEGLSKEEVEAKFDAAYREHILLAAKKKKEESDQKKSCAESVSDPKVEAKSNATRGSPRSHPQQEESQINGSHYNPYSSHDDSRKRLDRSIRRSNNRDRRRSRSRSRDRNRPKSPVEIRDQRNIKPPAEQRRRSRSPTGDRMGSPSRSPGWRDSERPYGRERSRSPFTDRRGRRSRPRSRSLSQGRELKRSRSPGRSRRDDVIRNKDQDWKRDRSSSPRNFRYERQRNADRKRRDFERQREVERRDSIDRRDGFRSGSPGHYNLSDRHQDRFPPERERDDSVFRGISPGRRKDKAVLEREENDRDRDNIRGGSVGRRNFDERRRHRRGVSKDRGNIRSGSPSSRRRIERGMSEKEDSKDQINNKRGSSPDRRNFGDHHRDRRMPDERDGRSNMEDVSPGRKKRRSPSPRRNTVRPGRSPGRHKFDDRRRDGRQRDRDFDEDRNRRGRRSPGRKNPDDRMDRLLPPCNDHYLNESCRVNSPARNERHGGAESSRRHSRSRSRGRGRRGRSPIGRDREQRGPVPPRERDDRRRRKSSPSGEYVDRFERDRGQRNFGQYGPASSR